MSKPQNQTFETLDFCYDLTDYLKSKGRKYAAIFLQITPKTNKPMILHGGFTEKDTEKVIPNISEYTVALLKPKKVVSSDDQINHYINILDTINIQYVILMIDKDKLEVVYNLRDNEALNLAYYLIMCLTGHIHAELTGITEDEEDEE